LNQKDAWLEKRSMDIALNRRLMDFAFNEILKK